MEVKDFPPEVMDALRAANDKLLKQHAEEDALAKRFKNLKRITLSKFVHGRTSRTERT